MSFLPKSIVLVDAIKRLSRRFLGMPHPRLLVGTWTGSKNCRYPTSVLARCLWHFPYNQSVLSHWHNTEISRVLFAKGSRTTLQRNREGLLTALSGASYFCLPAGWVGPALYELLKAVAWVVEGREGDGEMTSSAHRTLTAMHSLFSLLALVGSGSWVCCKYLLEYNET